MTGSGPLGPQARAELTSHPGVPRPGWPRVALPWMPPEEGARLAGFLARLGLECTTLPASSLRTGGMGAVAPSGPGARTADLAVVCMERPGRVFSREELLLGLWGDEEAASQECVTVLVSRLRRKLRAAGRDGGLRIRALWGVGYRLELTPAYPEAGRTAAGVAAG